MAQKRRKDVSPAAAARAIQHAGKLPAEIVKRFILQAALEPWFASDEIYVCDLVNSGSVATVYELLETGVAGTTSATKTYDFDLSTIGLPAGSKFALKTRIYLVIEASGDTHTVTIDADDNFTEASTGGHFTLDTGSCTINRAAGTIHIVVQGPTSNLTGDDWRMSAVITEGGAGAAPHGVGWGEADYSPREGLVEIRTTRASGGAFASESEGSIAFQSLPADPGTTFDTTAFRVAILMAPGAQLSSHATISYSVSSDPTALADYNDAGWTAMTLNASKDLIGDSLLYTTEPIALAASKYLLTIRVEMTAALPDTRDANTLIYGYAVGVN